MLLLGKVEPILTTLNLNHMKTSFMSSFLCPSVCYSHVSRTIHLIYFAPGRFVAADPKKCSVEICAILPCDKFNINTFWDPLWEADVNKMEINVVLQLAVVTRLSEEKKKEG